MAITAEDIQKRIAGRGLPNALRKRISQCVGGDCKGCTDLCPIRARNWRQRHAQRMRDIFLDPSRTVHELHLSCSTWPENAGSLADVNVQSIRKTASRALDSLHEPRIVAAGLIDAAWSGSKWKVGISLFVRAPRNIDVQKAFERTENIDLFDAGLAVRAYADLEQLLRGGQDAKTWPERRVLLKPGVCCEYYHWLDSLKPRARLFRYGCDHHFNVRPKSSKATEPSLPKRRSFPVWLTPHQYGSHPLNCECKICCSQQNR